MYLLSDKDMLLPAEALVGGKVLIEAKTFLSLQGLS
jgi:hypothetical protein